MATVEHSLKRAAAAEGDDDDHRAAEAGRVDRRAGPGGAGHHHDGAEERLSGCIAAVVGGVGPETPLRRRGAGHPDVRAVRRETARLDRVPLEKRAVLAARPQTKTLELRRDVPGDLFELRARRRAAEHRIVRDDPDAPDHVLWRDGVDGALHRRRRLDREHGRHAGREQEAGEFGHEAFLGQSGATTAGAGGRKIARPAALWYGRAQAWFRSLTAYDAAARAVAVCLWAAARAVAPPGGEPRAVAHAAGRRVG